MQHRKRFPLFIIYINIYRQSDGIHGFLRNLFIVLVVSLDKHIEKTPQQCLASSNVAIITTRLFRRNSVRISTEPTDSILPQMYDKILVVKCYAFSFLQLNIFHKSVAIVQCNLRKLHKKTLKGSYASNISTCCTNEISHVIVF